MLLNKCIVGGNTILLFLFVFFFTSCIQKDDLIPEVAVRRISFNKADTSIVSGTIGYGDSNGSVIEELQPNEKIRLSILCIGNSYTQDALSYVPFVLERVFDRLEIHLYILYKGSCYLENHWNNIESSIPAYNLYLFLSENGVWKSSGKKSVQDIMACEMWDLIVLQQESSRSISFGTYQPYLNNIINWLKDQQSHFRTAWLLTPAHADGYGQSKSRTSEQMWELVAANSKKLLDDGIVDYVAPCGTAVQMARRTSLDALGTYGHLSYDGLHLQEGLPCLLEAYAFSKFLLDQIGIESDINRYDLEVTQEWVNAKKIPGPHGPVITYDAVQHDLIRECAAWAVSSPFVLPEPGK